MFPRAFINSAIIGAAAYGGILAMATVPALNPHTTTASYSQIQPIIVSGTFEGRSKHETRGQATIVQTDAGYELRFAKDFYLDNAPTPSVGFGNDGEFELRIADLERKRGAQTYSLPASFTPANYSQVYVWCDDFAVPLGVATLIRG